MVHTHRIRIGGRQWYTHAGSGSGLEACNDTHAQDQDWRPAIGDMSRIKAGGLHSPPNTAACYGAHNAYTHRVPPTHTHTLCSTPHAKSEKKKSRQGIFRISRQKIIIKTIKKEKNIHACCLAKISAAINNPDCLLCD